MSPFLAIKLNTFPKELLKLPFPAMISWMLASRRSNSLKGKKEAMISFGNVNIHDGRTGFIYHPFHTVCGSK